LKPLNQVQGQGKVQGYGRSPAKADKKELKMEENRLPDFGGKIVVLYLSNASRAIQDGVVFEYASFKMEGNRLFVLGRIPRFDDLEWVANLQSGVAWESVNHYIILNSREDYINRTKSVKVPLLKRIFGQLFQV
jgi:hypothetical protein